MERRAATYNASLVLEPKLEDTWCARICMHFDPADRVAGKPGLTLRAARGAFRREALSELAKTFKAPPPASRSDRR